MQSSSNRARRLAAAIVPIVGIWAGSASAAVVYWDPTNGSGSGTGSTTPSAALTQAGLLFNDLADGTGNSVALATTDIANFSAGNDATGGFLVDLTAVGGNVTAAGLVVDEGEITLGSTNNLILGANSVAVNSGATLVTNSSARVSTTAGSVYTLNGGTLRTTNAASAGSFIDIDSTITLASGGGTFDYQVTNVLNIIQTTSAISGPGSFTKTGGGVLALSAPSTYVGSTTIDNGELRMRNGTNNNLPVGTALTVNANGILNLNQNIILTVGSLAGTGLVGASSGTFTVSGATSTMFGGSIRDVANAGAAGATAVGGKFIKNGISTLTLTGNNTYTGATTISNGSLILNNATGPALSGTASIAVNTATSSLVLGASNQIKDAASFTLNLGTFSTGGFTEGTALVAGVGVLTVSGAGASSIDFNTAVGTDVLSFANSSAATWAGTTLRVLNWTGTPFVGGGLDQLYFGTSAAGLTAAQLAKIQFYADGGSLPLGSGAAILSTGEVVAVPEPMTLAALGLGAVSLVGRRRRA